MERLHHRLSRETSLVFLLTAVYMTSYMTRLNFGSILVEMETATGFARDSLSLAVTGSFFSYGIGQIISGILGDRFSPRKLIGTGLAVTALMNLFVPFCRNASQMTVVWTVNGMAQSLLWPPIVRILHVYLSTEQYKQASATVVWGGALGTIAIYLLAPLLIALGTWKLVFLFSAGCGLVILPVFRKHCPEPPAKRSETAVSAEKESARLFFTPLFLSLMAAMVLQGIIRDCVTTWMPTYVADTYHLGARVSILSGVLLPIFNIICLYAARNLYTKKLRNPLTCAGVFFLLGTISAVVMYVVSSSSAAVSILLASLLAGCMHGTNLMVISMVPPFFKNVSTVSGVMNACIYAGSAISTYAVSRLSSGSGWRAVILIWGAAALFGTILCLANARPFRNHYLHSK